MDMHVSPGMLPQYVDGALLMRGISRPHPKQQTAMLQLLLKMACVPITHKLRQNAPDEAACAPGQRRPDNRGCHCTPRGDDHAGGRTRCRIERATDERSLRVAD